MSFFSNKQTESAMTLTELLIVMGIIALLLALGFGGYLGMRRIQQVEQLGQTLYSELRNQQREGLLYNRKLGEAWSYGIVMNLETIKSGNNPSVATIYKYCAGAGATQFTEYPINDPLPTEINTNGECVSGSPSLETIDTKILGDPIISAEVALSDGTTPAYLVMESLSGRVHFYDSNSNYLGSGDKLGLNIVLDNNSSKKRLIRFDSKTGRFELYRIDPSVDINEITDQDLL